MGTAAAIVGGGIASAIIGSKASSKASKAQSSSAKKATNAELEMYYQSRADLAPWREAGSWAVNALQSKISAGPGEYTESPGYQFRLGEGVKTLERGAAARGNLLSGAQSKALVQYGQDYATQDYDNYLQRYYQSLTPYQSMAGMGQTSANQTASMGTQVGQNIGQNYLSSGDARASSYINQANTLTGAISSGVDNFLLNKYLNK